MRYTRRADARYRRYSPSVRIVMTLLSIPSPSAFFPTTWNSYVVSGVSLLMVTWVLPDGVTGIVDQSVMPGSLYLFTAADKRNTRL